jgi:replicative DNA helicase
MTTKGPNEELLNRIEEWQQAHEDEVLARHLAERSRADEDDFETLETIAEPVEEKTSPSRDDAAEVHRLLEVSWAASPDAPVSTGLRGLDAVLRGGLRRGELVALAGSAGTGKSSLAIQLALEAARAGALAIYATVEMPREEVIARAIAREMFLLAEPSGRDWAVSFGDVLWGKHVAAETFASEHNAAEVLERYHRASETLRRDVWSRLVVHQLAPGATVASVREVLHRERAARGFNGLTVLVVDPLQRLFASATGERTGKVLASINATETERVGAVAQDLKVLCDDAQENLAAVFTSDTTKAAVKGDAQGEGLELRGSYQLAHWATVIAAFRAHEDPDVLAKRVEDLGDADLAAEAIRRAAPSAIMERDDAVRLGRRYAAVHIAKSRRGPPRSFACGFIPGAGLLLEGEALAETFAKPKSSKPKSSKPKTPRVEVKLSPMDSKRVADALVAQQTKTEPVEGES